ncbi:phospholipase D-like domain-containing protein [Acinetobacter shaoyimingii]|uniref:phospholipase D n=1 Tax=Acinetobacter shaoyimingii TaxID=2715164 RepID=A0A6G8RY31_9GAMM|nr:phospholipase D-like domain-containing protein [Acinetobacter shaoyimingii]QIO06839.1 phospholipase [Acinetobacter shaoyimingii]
MRIFDRIHQKLNWSRRRYFGLIAGLFVLGYLSSAIFHMYKPLPEGLNFKGKLRHADVKFLADQTFMDAKQQQQQEHHIFNEMLKLIDEAQTTIVVDMFLFNKEVGESKKKHEALTQKLTDALVAKKLSHPNIEIKFITDPVNSVYGGIAPSHYRELRKVGVDLIETDLTPLRASNPLWSGFWYLCCQNVGNNPEKGWLKNPLGEGKVTLRSYFALFNFKANHRKTLVVDTPEGWKALVTSMNPHDGSSRHSNVALVVSGAPAADVLKTEQVVGQMSKANMPGVVIGDLARDKYLPQVQVLTEKAILDAILNMLDTAKANDQIDLAMFYLSERQIIQALKDAKARGVKLRILLDPNKDAFGRHKNGIPNRPVASELYKAGIDVRWCNTQGEQCHSKMMIKQSGQSSEMILGSANFTARNLKNYNLETDIRVLGQSKAPVFVDAQQYFDTAWSNLNGKNMSVEYKTYADESKFKYATYRFMEWSGVSTF